MDTVKDKDNHGGYWLLLLVLVMIPALVYAGYLGLWIKAKADIKKDLLSNFKSLRSQLSMLKKTVIDDASRKANQEIMYKRMVFSINNILSFSFTYKYPSIILKKTVTYEWHLYPWGEVISYP